MERSRDAESLLPATFPRPQAVAVPAVVGKGGGWQIDGRLDTLRELINSFPLGNGAKYSWGREAVWLQGRQEGAQQQQGPCTLLEVCVLQTHPKNPSWTG